MIRGNQTQPTLVFLSRQPDDKIAREAVENLGADGGILEWGGQPQGLFTLLDIAARRQKALLPGRWFPARPLGAGGPGDDGRIFWVARGDASLAQLLGESELDPAWMGRSARPDEPIALLGVPGDVVSHPPTNDPNEVLRRTQLWMHQLGIDRVALALSHPANQLVTELARDKNVPCISLVDAASPLARGAGSKDGNTPLLWTDFQLDGEHRIPDETYVPGMRDLLHRGSLLRRRTLYERLPEELRVRADAELRALYGWHANPLLRRAGALLQTLMPLEGVEIAVPMPEVGGVCAYLLGLTDQKPVGAGDPLADARALLNALQLWDRRIDATVEPAAWPRLRARLASWADGGHLASCADGPAGKARRFCFSGLPLWSRVPLASDIDGIPRTPLHSDDRRALGWFELNLHAASLGGSRSRAAERSGVVEGAAAIEAFPFAWIANDEQLPLGLSLGLEGTGT